MNRKPSLQDVMQAFFLKRLFVPFAVFSLCALITVVGLQLREVYRNHTFFVKVLDRYVTTLLSGAHKTLRERALFYDESIALGKELALPSPVGFHRIFVFETPHGSSSQDHTPFRVPASVDVPLSYFPKWDEWPVVSIPYFSGRLNAVTVAILVRGDRFAAVGELNLDALKSLVGNFTESDPQNLVFIVDRYGNALYHPDPRILQSQENLAHEPLIKRALSYSMPQTVLDQLGGRLVFGYCWRVDPWDWVIVVGKPLIHAIVPSLFWGTMTAALAFLLFFSLLTSFRRRLGRIFVHPMMHMTAAVEAMSHDRKVKDLKAIAQEVPFSELAVFAEALWRTSQTVLDREAALVSQSRELHRILESIGEGVIVTDAKERVVRMNAEAEKLTGWHQIQALGRPVQNIFSIFDAKTGKPLEDSVSHVMASGAPQKTSGHVLLKAADGSEVFVIHSAAPIRDESGGLQGVVMVFHDVSAEFAARKLVEESERKYREIMETMEEVYMELDPKGRVTFCNPALLKILGCSWDELQNRTYRDFTDPATAESMKAFFSHIFATGASLGLQDFVIHDASGRRKVVEISAGVRRAEDGQPMGFRVLSRDITEKTEAQERSRALERMLMQTQKMESLGTLASGIAHEFNNLLQAMSGYLEMALNKTDPDDPRSRWLARVQEASFRARDLVRRLLSFARQTEPALEPLDFNQVVEDTLDLLKKSIPRMIEIQKDLAPNLPVLVADRLQVEQVVINLTANARDAIGLDSPGVIRVRTSSHNDEDGREWIRLEVSDTGSGIPEEIRERIFDPFFTTKEPGKGTGLGLSTIYGIVTAHEGCIACESQVGRGTTFRVDFPVRAWAPQGTKSAVGDENAPRHETPVGATVLLVDDEESLLELIQGLLEMEGYAVRTAPSGEEALAFLAQTNEDIDAVVLDLSMPGMGGRRCLEFLRATYPHLPVIVASGDAAHEIFRDPKRFGAQGVILKPYRLENLLEALQSVLRSSSDDVSSGTDGA